MKRSLPQNQILKIGQAAKALGICIETLRRWDKAGKLKPIITPGGTRFYSLKEIQRIKSTTPPTLNQSLNSGSGQVLNQNTVIGSAPQLHPLWENTTSAITPITHISHIPSKPHLLLKKLTILAPLTFTVLFLFISTLVFAGYSYLPSSFPSSFPIPSFLSSVILEGVEQPIGSRFYRGLQPLQNDNNNGTMKPTSRSERSKQFNNSPAVLAAETVKQILEINADTNIYGLLTSEGLTINGAGSFTSLTASSSATFSGPATFNGGLTSTGNTTLSNLSILGPTTLTNTSTSNSLVINNESGDTSPFVVDSSGNVGIGTTSTNSYKAYISGTLYTSGASSFGSTLAVTGATTLSSTLTVSGASTLSSTLEVSGKLTAKDELAVSGATTLSGALTTSGATTLSSTLAVTGASTFSSTGTFSGKLTTLGNVGIAGNVGIGTTSPVTLLDVNNKLNVLSGGNVGVGTTSPAFKLQVAGDLGPSLDATYNLRSASNQWKNLYLSGISAIGGQATFTSSPTGTSVSDGVVYINPPTVADNSYTLFGIAVNGTEKLRMDGSGNITVQGNLLGPEGGSIGYWSRAGTTLYPYTSGDHITTLGNVGIGTTTPAGALHVVGQCVTGDTLLKRRRRRQRHSGGEGTEPIESDDNDWEDVPVEEIKPGDEILSLNDKTGEFEWHQVEKTMDKGFQEVWKLVTQKGKWIETTSEHPYLTIEKDIKPLPESGKFEVDLSTRIEKNFDSFVAIANKQTTQVIKITAKEKLEFKKLFTKSPKLFAPTLYALAIVEVINSGKIKPSGLKICTDYLSYERRITNIINHFYPEIIISFAPVGHVGSFADRAAYQAFSQKRKTGAGSNLQGFPAAEQLHDDWLHRSTTHTVLMNKSYHKFTDLSIKSASWKKVKQLKPGDIIATVSGWEKIQAKYSTGRKHTYDLQIEGTHNFVGNNIVAHNTYLMGGNVGLGTTNPTALFHVANNTNAFIRIETNDDSNPSDIILMRSQGTDSAKTTVLTGDNVGRIFGQAYSGSAWYNSSMIGMDVEGTIASNRTPGRITFSTMTNAAPSVLTERMRIDSAGNVGIGTTNPGGKLAVIGGYLGIGTTSPVRDLDISTGNIGFGNSVSPSNERGIYWDLDGNYAIYRTAGTWLSDPYQQLKLNWITGIILNPGTDYGKSYVDIQGGGLRVTAGNVGIGTTNPGNKLTVSGNVGIGTTAFVNAALAVMGGNVGIGTTSPTNFNLEIAGSIGPTASSTYNLGSSSKKWANLYVDNIVTSGDTSITAGTASTDLGDGADGAITVSTSKNLNTTNVITGRSCSDGGDMVSYNVTSVTDSNTVVLESGIASGCLAAGDEVLLINLQGTSSNNGNVGNYETFTIDSISTTSTTNDTVNFSSNKTKYYGDGTDSDDTNIGTATTNQRVILQRIPNYTNVTIQSGGTITADDWAGGEGGMLFFRASGAVDVQSGGTITMAGKGYRGGAGHGCGAGNQGESYGGTGSGSRNANLGAGGGASGCDNNGGGGGGYGTAGSNGTGNNYGYGGSTYGQASLTKIYSGSGGGGGSHGGGNGGDGGGVIFISANTLTVSGTINNNGDNGTGGSFNKGGGGGSGGSVYLLAPNLTVGSSLVTVSAGAAGGIYAGAGGNGRIRLDYDTVSGTTSPTAGSTNTIAPSGLVVNQQGLGHILSLKSSDIEKFYIDHMGNIVMTNTASAGDSLSLTANSQTIGNVFNVSATGLTTGSLFKAVSTFSNSSGTGYGINYTLTDSTTNAGAYSAIKVDTTGSGTGTGNKYLLDLNSASAAKFSVDTSGNTSLAGSLYSDNLTLTGGTSASPAQNIGLGTGADGAITVSTSKNLNTTNVISGRTCTDGGDMVSYNVTSVTDSNTVVLESAVASGCLVSGDEVLLINLQGTSTNYANVGNWETLKIDSVSSDTVNFTTNKTKYYGDNSYDDTNIGTATTNQRVILQRVPNYTNVTVQSGGTITADDWAGGEGGILFFRASGTVDVQSGGTISLTGKGFRGGAGAGCGNSTQGESYGGIGSQSGSSNLGGGGGGQGCDTGGGGGGGYGATGTTGSANNPGTGGSSYGAVSLTKLYPGSGGGGGGWGGDSGGDGGGIVFISANILTVSGTINNNGNNGTSIGYGSGGGSGGSVYLLAPNLTVGSSLVTASGGTGGGSNGGAGSVGRIRLDYNTISGTTSPSAGSSNSSSPQLVINEKGIDKIISLQNSGNERLYVDANGNLILNSSSPSGTTQLLDVRSLSSSKFTILSNGNIGIGTTTPGNLFSLTGGNVGIGTTATINGAMAVMGGNVGIGVTNPSAPLMVIGGGTTTGFLTRFQDSAYTDRVTILDNGNVGIGATSPNYPLEVSGAAGIAAWSTSGGTIRLHTHERDSAGPYYPTKITYAPVFLAPESNLLSFYVANGTANGAGTEGGRQVRVMNLTGAGNVGIGTTAPSAAFSVAENFKVTSAGVVTGGTYNKVTITSPASAATLTLADGSSLITSGAYSLTLTTTNTTNVTLPTTGTLATLAGTESFSNKTFTGDTFFPLSIWNTGGNIGIGTTTPSVGTRLAVMGGNVGIGTTSPSAPFEVKGTGTGAVIAKFTDVNTTGCAIATDGTISCSSDINLKKNISSLDYGLSEVLKLRPVNYNWKNQDDSVTKNLGFIAQEVESIIPKLVSTDDTGLKQLNTIGMVPVLTKSIQELYSEISNLKDQISKIQTEASSSASSVIPEGDSIGRSPGLQNDNNLVILEGGDSQLIGSLDSLATPSASLQNDIFVVSEATISAQLTAYKATIQEVFKSLGETFLGNTTIAGSFSIDGTMSLTGNSLSTLGTLYLQNGPLAGDIDLFNGLVKIDNKGNAVAQTITVKKINVEESAGKDTLPAGTKQVVIKNSLVTKNSLIFLTPVTVTDQVLSVSSKKEGLEFIVEVKSPALEDIEFNWWIVN